jgi:Mpv17 / PMP22 family
MMMRASRLASRPSSTGRSSVHRLLLRLVLLLAGGGHHHVLHAAAFSLDGWDHLIHHATATVATVHHHHHHAAAAASLPFLTSVSPKALLQHLQGPASLPHLHHQHHLAHNHHNPQQFAAVVKHQFDGMMHAYRAALHENPLVTKMITGGTLAVMGDAIAQRRQQSQSQMNDDSSTSAAPVSSYDARRAASFMAFDMAYRALQHFLFPLLVANCHGQFLSQLLPHQLLDSSLISMDSLAAMERTLGSQLGIVPFLYYPVFFTFTGFLQGLTVQGSWARAVDNFPNLMKRNLVFWIPVQFVQFGFVPDDLQIPFLSAAGLCWTFILSMAAGSAQAYTSPTQPPGPPPLATSEETAGGIDALASMPTTMDEGVAAAAAALEAQSATSSEQQPKQAPVAA